MLASANGSQGYGGSVYTVITSTDPFSDVLFVSTSNSFEFAELEYSPLATLPEPASLAVLGVGLLGLAMARGRMGRRAS